MSMASSRQRIVEPEQQQRKTVCCKPEQQQRKTVCCNRSDTVLDTSSMILEPPFASNTTHPHNSPLPRIRLPSVASAPCLPTPRLPHASSLSHPALPHPGPTHSAPPLACPLFPPYTPSFPAPFLPHLAPIHTTSPRTPPPHTPPPHTLPFPHLTCAHRC